MPGCSDTDREIRAQCNLPTSSQEQVVKQFAEANTGYQPTYDKTGLCICCPDKDGSSVALKSNIIQSADATLRRVKLKAALEVGPYTPGEVADNMEYAQNVTLPYAGADGPKYCPCAAGETVDRGGAIFKVLKGQQKQSGLDGVCKISDLDECCQRLIDEKKDQYPKLDNGPPIKGNQPCYMPQFEDSLQTVGTKQMGPIGPWATGRVDWGPLSQLTGTRPVVDKYTITMYSEGEWRKQVSEAVRSSDGEVENAAKVDFESRQAISQARVTVDKNQQDSTERLDYRSRDIVRWKCELERAIAAASDEIDALEMERARLKRAGAVLTLPEMIVGECLDRRTSRLGPELVRDEVEEQLTREYALFSEIRQLFNRTLDSLNIQMTENRTAKQRLEYDWSDKRMAADIDIHNVSLNNRSNIILFKPGAVRFMDQQSSKEHWEHFTRETIAEGERTRQRSIVLRSTLDAILVNSARDLRTQADRVDEALAKKTRCIDELVVVLEDKLKLVLKSMVDLERLTDDLQMLIRRLDAAMKVAQTRLHNRMQRDRVENCRDAAQVALMDEVKQIAEQASTAKAQLAQANNTLSALVQRRGGIELQLMNLMKTLQIDRERIGKLRSFYPSAAALMGKG